MHRQIIFLLLFIQIFLFLPTKLFAEDICFQLNPVGKFDEQTCNPVKVDIQYTDCKSAKALESVNGAMARFECTRKVKRLKYWHNNAMLFADLSKKNDSYTVTKTYAVDYGRKDGKSDTVLPKSSVLAVPLPAEAPLPNLEVKAEAKPNEAALNDSIEKATEPLQTAKEEIVPAVPSSVPPSQQSAAEPASSTVVTTPLEQKKNSEQKTFLSEVKLHGLIDFYYLYNLNQNSGFVTPTTSSPSPTTNVIYFPNTYNDQFTVNLAVLGAKKEATPWGFNIDLAFGPGADHMAGSNSDNSLRALNQAFVVYKTPFDLKILVGRFHSFLGFESHFASENINYTKSYGLVYLVPSLAEGVGLIMPFGDLLEISFYATNGWDIHYENNRSKVFGGKIKYMPIEEVELVGAAMGGNENVTGNDALTTILEGTAIWKPSKEIKMAVDFTGGQSSVAGNNPRKAGSLSVYGWWKFMSEMAVSARYEIYTDDSLFPTGVTTQTYVTSTNQTINAITATLEYIASDNLKFKAEYRTDTTSAEVPVFKDSNQSPTNTQSLVVGAAVLSF